ncbi:hypothetical protein BH10BAC4_BH10BAC4_19770 [soil metagenome]
MATYPQLRTPPIKEIIFTISFEEKVSLIQLQQFCSSPIITAKFPSISPGFHTNITNVNNNEPPKSESQVDGFLLRSHPISHILSVKRGTFSFHRVNGYETFEKLYSEVDTYWTHFKNFAPVDKIINLSIRYVNFIEAAEEIDIDNLLSLKLKHPFSEKLEGFFAQIRFKYEPNPAIDVNVVASGAKDNKKSGVVLDIILNKRLSDSGLKGFLDMREVKNKVFFDCITDFAVKKFNHENIL